MSFIRRPVRLRLKGGRTLTGRIHISEGLPLLGFLSSRNHFLNVTDVTWSGADAGAEDVPHLSVRLSQIVWVEPRERGLHLSSAALPTAESRAVELHLEGELHLHVQLNIARETRMSDYLDANTSFLPLWSARIVRTGEVMERVALNHEAIFAIRELEETDPGPRPERADGDGHG